MADELVNKIEFDVSGAKRALNDLQKTLEQYNLTVEDLVQAEKEMNESGKLTGLTLRFIGKEGQELVKELGKVGNKFAEVGTSFRQVNEIQRKARESLKQTALGMMEQSRAAEAAFAAFRRLSDAQDDFRRKTIEANQASQAQKALIDFSFAKAQTRLSVAAPSEITGLNSAIETVVQKIREGRFSLVEFQNTFEAFSSSGARALVGLSKDLSQSVTQIDASIRKIGSSFERTSASSKRLLDNQIARGEQLRRAYESEVAAHAAKENRKRSKELQVILETEAAHFASLEKREAAEASNAEKQRAAARIKIASINERFAREEAAEQRLAKRELERVIKVEEAHHRARQRNDAAEERSAERQRAAAQRQIALIDERFARQDAASERAAKRELDRLIKIENAHHRLREKQLADRTGQNLGLQTVNDLRAQRPQGLDVQQLAQSEQILGRINTLFARGKVNLQDYNATTHAVANGITGNLNPAQQRLAELLIRLRQVQEPLPRQFERVRDAADQAGQRVLLTWSGVFRLFLVQTIHRSIGALTFAFQNATRAAIDFGIKIAEIQTVSLNSSKSFGQWASEIEKLSNAFGQDQAKVAEAAYEALSNQVVEAADSYNFLTEALKFSITSVTTADNAVNLLSGAINAFGLKSSNAADLSAKFFKAIELGRFRADELANTYGRVATTANALRISNDELLATLTVLTRQGVDAAEAQTLINNVMLKLIKPTEEMSALFKEWGVANGQAAIAAFGLDGVLRRLNDESQKGVQRTAELLNEFRSLRGGLGLASEGFKQYVKDLEEIKNASKDDAKSAFLKVMESDSKKLQIELTKLKNFFVNELGTRIVTAMTKISESFGGFIRITKISLAVLAFATTAFVTYRAALLLTSTTFFRMAGIVLRATTLFGSFTRVVTLARFALNGLSVSGGIVGAIAVAAGFLAAKMLQVSLNTKTAAQTFDDYFADLQQKSAETVQRTIEEEQRKTDAVLEGFDQRLQAFFQYAARVQKAADDLADKAKEQSEKSAEAFKDYIDVLLKEVDRMVKDAEDRVERLQDLIDRTREKINEAPADNAKDQLERNLGREDDPIQKAKILQAEIDRIQKEAQEALRKGLANNDVAQLQNAEALAERQKELAKQLFELRLQHQKALSKEEDKASKEKLAKEAAVLAAQGRANEVERKALLAQLTQIEKLKQGGGLTPKQLRDLDERQRGVQAQLDKVTEANKKVEEAQKRIKELQDAQVNNAQALNVAEAQILASLKEIEKIRTNLINLAEQQRLQEEKDANDLKLRQESFKTATKNLVEFKVDVDRNQVFGKTEDEIFKNALKVSADALAEFDKRAAEVREQALKVLDPAQVIALDAQIAQRRLAIEQQLQAELNAAKQAARTQAAAAAAEDLKKQQQAATEAVNKATQDANNQAIGAIAAAKTLVEKLREIGADATPLAGAQIQKLENLITNFEKTRDPRLLQEILKQQGVLQAIIKISADRAIKQQNLPGWLQKVTPEQVRAISVEFQKLFGFIGQFNVAQEQAMQAAANNEAIKRKLTDFAKQFEDMMKEVKDANADANAAMQETVDQTIKRVQQLIDKYRELATVAANAPRFDGRLAALGGPAAFFANGGQARQGLDLVNANLRRGEFVINQRSTSRFYNQLVAMNQDRQPRNFSTGGNVQTIGDINVTVSDQGSGAKTGQEIGREIRRQLRLRTLKF